MSSDPVETNYVAFISYAREDEAFARQLETEIEAHRPPDGRAAPHVFRDRSDFTGSEYHRALEGHLRKAETLIVVCSPHARKSEYVGDEIRWFAKLHGRDRIFPILLSGLPDNEADELRAFPPALLDVMEGIPLGAEYRGFGKPRDRLSMGRYEAEWYKLLGNLYGLSPSEVRGRDRQRQMLALRKRYAASMVVVILLMASLAGVWKLKAQAEHASAEAVTEKLRAEAAEKEALKQQRRAEALEADAKAKKEDTETQLAVEVRKNKPDSVAANTIAARVYFQIWNDEQRLLADKLKAALVTLKYAVPRYERLSVGPTDASELRYFRDAEKDEAQHIVQTLKQAGLGDVVLKKIPGYENSTNIRPRHFELWLSPGAA